MTIREGVGKYLMENDSRLTIIQTDGTVIYDNAVSKIDENHLQREEVQQALDTGKGSTIRKSDTNKTIYIRQFLMKKMPRSFALRFLFKGYHNPGWF